MRLISWNLSYQHKINPKIDLLKRYVDSDTIVVLQETVPHYTASLEAAFVDEYHLFYSLNKREPSAFDGKERKLGVMVIVPKSFERINFEALQRTPFPDRTVYLKMKKNDITYSLFGLHSVTGVDYKKAKSVQYFTFAESVQTYKPDFVMIDANEPKIDHPEIDKIEFFHNKDKGKGVKTFFSELLNNGLADSFRSISKSNTIPLTVSHKVNKKFDRRYDYIFVNINKYDIKNVEYIYDEAIEVGSDHAIVICDITPKNI
jgi:exonuclease III